MKSIRQTWRRAGRAIMGILLLTLASAMLCVCLGQSFAASMADSGLDEKFITLAFPSDQYSAEADSWAKEYTAAHPETVKTVSLPVLASAHIPALSHDNFTDHLHYKEEYQIKRLPYSPFDRAVFEILITGIVSNTISGKIINVISLEDGYADPTDFDVEFEANGELFELGARYLICAQDYIDKDFLLRNALSQKKKMELYEAFDHEKFSFGFNGTARVKYGDLFTLLEREQLNQYRSVTFSVSTEEHEKYFIPAFVKLSGSAEEFLASAEGEVWKNYIEELEVSYHSFPVVGVSDLMHLAHFARGNALVIEGEVFGADDGNVCVISETLALRNNLKLGDMIDISYFEKDFDYPGELSLAEGEGTFNPSPAIYDSETTPLHESEKYKIVGIYRKGDEWTADDYQSFTPNTIFVPEKSIKCASESGTGGLFTTFILTNGTMEDFAHTVAAAGFDEQFFFDDNGYGDMQRGISEYGESADKIVILGFAVWAVILVLFLMLYPARLGKELDTMDSLGCTRAQRISFVLSSSLCLLIPGSVLGVLAGSYLWVYVTDFLTASIAGGLSMNIESSDFLLVGGASLAFSALAVALLAIPLTKTRGLDKRK